MPDGSSRRAVATPQVYVDMGIAEFEAKKQAAEAATECEEVAAEEKEDGAEEKEDGAEEEETTGDPEMEETVVCEAGAEEEAD
jgi:hypothetical protein